MRWEWFFRGDKGCGALGIRDRKGGNCLARNVNRRHGRHMCMVLRGHLLMVIVFSIAKGLGYHQHSVMQVRDTCIS